MAGGPRRSRQGAKRGRSVASRGNGRSILAALLAAALAAVLAAPDGGRGPFGLAIASGDGSLPVLKGEMGDFSYFDGHKPVPPISFEHGQGNALRLADFKGKAAIEPYFRDNKLAHLGIYIDREGKGFHAWQGSGVPTSFIIGRDGRARGMLLGAADWDSPAAVELIRHFIAEGRAHKLEE